MQIKSLMIYDKNINISTIAYIVDLKRNTKVQ